MPNTDTPYFLSTLPSLLRVHNGFITGSYGRITDGKRSLSPLTFRLSPIAYSGSAASYRRNAVPQPLRGVLIRLQPLQLHSKVAHQWSLFGNSQTTGDSLTTVIHILQCCGDHLHVVVGIYAARDTQAYQIQT